MRVAAILSLSYVLLAVAVLSDIFHVGPDSILFRSISFGLPILIAAIYLPGWALGIVSVVVVPSWVGSAVWRNSAGSDIAVLDARLLDLYPLLILLIFAFALSTALQKQRQHVKDRERLARVGHILEHKATREDAAEEFLALAMPSLQSITGIVWLADPTRLEARLIAEVGLSPTYYPGVARIPLSAFNLVGNHVVDLPNFASDPTASKNGAVLTTLMDITGTQSAYVYPLVDRGRLVGITVFLRNIAVPASEANRLYIRDVARLASSQLTSKPERPIFASIHPRMQRRVGSG